MTPKKPSVSQTLVPPTATSVDATEPAPTTSAPPRELNPLEKAQQAKATSARDGFPVATLTAPQIHMLCIHLHGTTPTQLADLLVGMGAMHRNDRHLVYEA